jgi:hypothetical protein
MLYPKCLLLRDVDLTSKVPQGAGKFGDVYKEVIQGLAVALKVVKVYVSSNMDEIRMVGSHRV